MRGINFKKVVLIIASAAIIICIVSCVRLFTWKYNKEVSLQIADQNGNDKNLCFITDDMIFQNTEDYRSIKRHVSSKGLHTSGISGYYEDCDNEYTFTKIGMLSGIYICNATKGTDNEIIWTIDSKVTNGNFRIIITDENNYIVKDVPIDQKIDISILGESGKIYYVKFVAESAEIQVELWRKINE